MILLELIYILFTVGFAYLNALWIKKGRRIYHFWNGLLHVVVASLFAYFFWLPCFFIVLLNTRIFFDSSLNLFRGFAVDRVSNSPKSIADKVEKWVFDEDGMTPKVLYLVFSLTLNVLYLVFETK